MPTHRNISCRISSTKDSNEAQAWQFLGLAITTYCPDQLPVLQRASVNQPPPAPPGQPNLAAEQPS